MRRLLRILAPAALALLAAIPNASAAANEQFIQIALWHPVQIFPAETSIRGVRLNLLYGVNKELRGLDVGLVNRNTGLVKGLQHGVVGMAESDFLGWQDNIVANLTDGKMTGLQSGAYNQTAQGEGVQWGFVNVADSFHGFQFGLLNKTNTMEGLQVGLVNIISKAPSHPILPIVNWSF